MKKIYKLKDYKFQNFTYVKEEDAQEMYKNGNPSKRIALGFYSVNLSFEEWLNRNKFKIL
jgi:hypothetical protein